MKIDYPEAIGALSTQQRLYFYELLAHFLTVSMRGVLFFEGIPDQDRVERAKWLNEIAHRITYKVFAMSKKPSAGRTDLETWDMIRENVEKHPETEADVNAAIEMSYRYLMDHESDG